MGYDQHFQQIAASQPGRSWNLIDPTLRNLAFAGQAKPHIERFASVCLIAQTTVSFLQKASHNW